jgi:MFS family permease
MANIGTWMRDVGLGWTMTELSPSATLVAAVQASAALPVVLLALPAGALADVLDRRRLLFAAQSGLGLLSLALALLAWFGLLTPAVLLLAAALGWHRRRALGAGLAGHRAAARAPPGAAPSGRDELARREHRPRHRPGARRRGVGGRGRLGRLRRGCRLLPRHPRALAWWKMPAAERRAPPEALGGAMRAGLRYARSSPALRRVLGRATAFLLFAAAPWALLPLVARGFVGGGPGLYGLLLAAIGLGAVAGALLLPMLRTRLGLGADGTVLAGTLGVALAAAGMATAPAPWLAILSCLLLGLAWIGVLTSLNVAAQSALPDWVRARGLALYLSVFSGSMMTGGLAWGSPRSSPAFPRPSPPRRASASSPASWCGASRSRRVAATSCRATTCRGMRAWPSGRIRWRARCSCWWSTACANRRSATRSSPRSGRWSRSEGATGPWPGGPSPIPPTGCASWKAS